MSKTRNRRNPTQEFIEARLKLRSDGTRANTDTIAMWRATETALRDCGYGSRFDPEIAIWLADIIDELLANRWPNEMSVLHTRSGTRDTRSLIKAKETAALYRQAVTAKAVMDKSPIKTLAAHFGATEQTVRNWINNSPKDAWKRFSPNVSFEQKVRRLEIRMKHSGKLVGALSKTNKSIMVRNSKR